MRVFLLVILFLTGFAKAGTPSLSGLRDFEGKPVSSTENRVLVVFWASWCDSCREKLTGFLPQWDARPGLSVITVNTDSNPDRARSFVDRNSIRLPVYRDPDGVLTSSLKVQSVPHWAVYRGALLIDTAEGFDQLRVERALASGS
ncbi:MAG: TlpA family protein disulfide reductase [Bdellovibrionales bacterium]|nr:TlpA family protein disulfide reductase [Bdellovibrionales bacterium]